MSSIRRGFTKKFVTERSVGGWGRSASPPAAAPAPPWSLGGDSCGDELLAGGGELRGGLERDGGHDDGRGGNGLSGGSAG